MALRTTQVEELPGLNLTSMIDVVFLLLIFFMVATNFSQSQQQIGVKLTGGAGAQSMLPTPDKLDVTVARDGTLTFDNKPISITELTNAIRAKHAKFPGLVVGVNGARDASCEALYTTMAAVRSAANVEVRMGLVR
jgi:biopolymer transport protein ExbD